MYNWDRLNPLLGLGYRWSGGHGASPNPLLDGFDCSGLVRAAMLVCGVPHSWLATDRSSGMLWDDTDRCSHLEGALAFYGTAEDRVNHVVLCVSGGRVLSASGGGSWATSAAIGKARGATVRLQSGPEYRSDLLGFGWPPWGERNGVVDEIHAQLWAQVPIPELREFARKYPGSDNNSRAAAFVTALERAIQAKAA